MRRSGGPSQLHQILLILRLSPIAFLQTHFPQSPTTMKKITQTKTITTQTNGSAPVTHAESHSIEIVDINETTDGQPINSRPGYSRRAVRASNLSEAIPKLEDDDTFWTGNW
jgi:hypothetical protein